MSSSQDNASEDMAPLGSQVPEWAGGQSSSAQPQRPRTTTRYNGRGVYDFLPVVSLRTRAGERPFPCSAKLVDVIADGNCCFRAMALIL